MDIGQSIHSNFFIALLISYISGILVSFTPCVYPLIPVTITYIGAKTVTTKTKAFFISLIYVLGISVTYTTLGAIASLTGRVFGTLTQHPIVYLIVGSIFILLGLSLFDVFQISLPVIISPRIKRSGLFSTFLIGIVSGLVIGPCTAPALGAILTFVATRQNIIYGMSLLFCFALGIGTLLIVVGTFSGIILPKSGKWLNKIKKILGFGLILIGIYFIITIWR